MQYPDDAALAQDYDDILETYIRSGLNDLEEWRRSSKGKSTVKTDEDIAFEFFVEDAAAMLSVLNDAELARRLQDQEEEEPESSSEQGSPEEEADDTVQSPASASNTESTSSLGSSLSFSDWTRFFPGENIAGGSSSSLAYKKNVNCVSCSQTINGNAVKVPCGHSYDSECLVNLFASATMDESLFPPSCCEQAIPVTNVRTYMGLAALDRFEEKAREFTTPNRVYCCNESCKRFLGSRRPFAFGISCTSCETMVCGRCSYPAHPTSLPCRGIKRAPKGPRTPTASSSSHTRQEKVDCVVCMDPIHGEAIKVPCGHFYDADCLLNLFNAATTDESLFPPRCCKQTIPLDNIRKHMEWKKLLHYEEKAREFSTPVRLYCSDKTCSKFLGPRTDTVSNIACVACSKTTCARCSNPAHSIFSPCPDDALAEEVLELGREHGWQRCPGCRTLVELNLGCYHMTCRCRAQFCYLCAQTWKTCACPQWDETRLLAAAEERVERMPERHIQQRPVEHAERVRRMAEDLRVNHDCQHGSFAYRSGGGRCETCQDYLPTYLLRCTGCQIRVCRRCRWNRL